ncbi:hypothetical protein QQP08_004507 [Theobroma cacao]|uniref:Uncharacterized protein n=1 Tax=Theobroma cacao TaxID=3641 RepID=A0A061FT20_THECC|nr:Uncharacterized protein TCM_045251 [Theobroma cacao]WRX12020.1 hypothetical protein QQP08_004507 [Theobroma cacao]
MAADKVPANVSAGTTYLDNGLIYINSAAILSVKLTTTNYSGRRAQFKALLRGYGLIGYVDGSKPCPVPLPPRKRRSGSRDTVYELWKRQDQLVLLAILTSLSEEWLPR